MAYGDIAWNSENPFPGTLYNGKDGINYHEGCNIDYYGSDVNKDNFMSVLKGEADKVNLTANSTGRVLGSNADSNVFIYFSDHGAPGHLLFPETIIYADELNHTIQMMHQNSKYKQLVLFIEACESGSLFSDIELERYNAIALTATNSTDPSYGTYCYPHDLVNDQHMYTCLADLFSNNWMEYLERN